MSPMRRHSAGFTWIELVLVLAVFAILAALAIPSLRDTTIRKQVKEGFALADLAKQGVQAAYSLAGEMPADNAAAGIPPRDKIVGNLVKDVEVKAGAVTVTYGNNAAKLLEGKKVTLRPAIVPDQPRVPIAWICHNVAIPQGMEVKGLDETNLEPEFLPVECRGPAAAK
jgi:type IV pilus assembly protein PilA